MDVLTFDDASQWESWLAEHHERSGGAWLKLARKGSDRTSLTPAEAHEVALCYGWIDSQRKPYDAASFLQRYSRRRPRSPWSKVNVDKVEALTTAGRMRAPGLAEVAAAKADGRWQAAYESQGSAEVPPDLTAALADNQQARAFYASLGKSDRYLVILRLATARTPQTRSARLRRMVAQLAAGERVR